MYNKYVHKQATLTDRLTGNRFPVDIGYYEDDQPQPIRLPAATKNSHPLLIAGIFIGLFAGFLAALPRPIRGFVVLAIIGGIIWFAWSIAHDNAYAGAYKPVASDYYVLPDIPEEQPAPSPTVEVRRAQLVRLPNR